MKAIFKISAVVALMFFTVASKANEPKHFVVANKDSKSFVFHMDLQSQETTIKLFDANDVVVYFEKINHIEAYNKKFDLSHLNDGEYILKAENTQKVIEYVISVNQGSVAVLERGEDVKPSFRRKGDKLFMNFLNVNEDAVDVKVYDSSNRLVFNEKMEGKVLVEKAFNFENAYSDTYTVSVKDKKNVYYQEVVVE